MPQLGHIEAFTRDGITRNGQPGLLSADGFDMAWHQYHGHLIDRLNQLTAGMASPASIPILSSIADNPLLTSSHRHTVRQHSHQ